MDCSQCKRRISESNDIFKFLDPQTLGIVQELVCDPECQRDWRDVCRV
jgi:hypothetical protein